MIKLRESEYSLKKINSILYVIPEYIFCDIAVCTHMTLVCSTSFIEELQSMNILSHCNVLLGKRNK